MDVSDALKILDVSSSASKKEIKANYYKLVKKYHPDLHPSNHERFVKIQKAYETLICQHPPPSNGYPHQYEHPSYRGGTMNDHWWEQQHHEEFYRRSNHTNIRYTHAHAAGGTPVKSRFSNRALVTVLLGFVFIGYQIQMFRFRRLEKTLMEAGDKQNRMAAQYLRKSQNSGLENGVHKQLHLVTLAAEKYADTPETKEDTRNANQLLARSAHEKYKIMLHRQQQQQQPQQKHHSQQQQQPSQESQQ